jgi:hypothetical protein
MKIKYTRLYAGADGESHFAEIEDELKLVDFAPPGAPLNLSSFIPASQVAFFGAAAGWQGDWHPSPARNLFVVISGEWEVRTSDGGSRLFGPGSIVLVEDTTGKGHASQVIGNSDSLAVLVQLSDS